jgi:hypothetical protein
VTRVGFVCRSFMLTLALLYGLVMPWGSDFDKP